MGIADINTLIEDFAQQIIEHTETSAAARVQAALSAVFSSPAKRGPNRSKQATAAAAKSATGRRPMKITAKVARARKQQGQYLGALRGLGQADRAKVKSVAKEKGVPAALKLVASLKKTKK